ncbi:MAG: hypothetical protein QOE93_1405 [Actinomycetota bacterium]|jgi:hypothetical protein|nr:hypothetical protein [Actinomycetota bacterium]
MIRVRVRGRGRGRAGVAAGLALAVVVLLAGCTTIRGLIDTENALERAGFTEVDVSFDSAEGFDTVDVKVQPAASAETADSQLERATSVVWTTFPLRFDLLRVELVGRFEGQSATYTYGELAEIFGPRPPELDEKELGDDVVRAGLGIAIVLAVGGLLFVAAVVLAIIFGVRASRHRKSVVPPPWPPVPR